MKGDIYPAENEAFAKLKNKHAAFAARHEKGNRIVRQIVMIFQVNAVAVYVVVGVGRLYLMTPSSLPTLMKEAIALSSCSCV